MEFKKPNRPGRRLTSDVIRRDPPVSRTTRPVSQSPPNSAAETSIAPATPPSTTQQKSRVRRLLSSKKIVISMITLILIACILAGFIMLRDKETGSSNKAATSPDYQTVLPAKKTIDDLGGWKRISPEKNDPVFAYADTISGIAVSVSQQPLPESFKNDTHNQVAELAKKFNATTVIDAGDIKAYLGTSAKGPQSVIFIKDDVLVLIKSQKKINDASWKKYIQSLT